MNISTECRGAQREWKISVRLGTFLNRCNSHVVQTYLLAGLLLMISLPVPDSLRVFYGDDMKVPAESRDSLPDDAEPPEGEPASDEFGLHVPGQRRSRLHCVSNGVRSSRPLLPWTILAAFGHRPWWLIRFDTGEGCAGHFLAEGRALRLWVQSQTC